MPTIRVNVAPVQRIIKVDTVRRAVQVGIQGAPGRDASALDDQQAETDSSILAGQPLYLKSNGHADLAIANNIGTSRVCGLASEDAIASLSVTFKSGNTLELLDWTAVIGSVELTPGALYFLDPDNAGKLTTIAPTLAGQVVAMVGHALSFTTIAIEIQTIFLL